MPRSGKTPQHGGEGSLGKHWICQEAEEEGEAVGESLSCGFHEETDEAR